MLLPPTFGEEEDFLRCCFLPLGGWALSGVLLSPIPGRASPFCSAHAIAEGAGAFRLLKQSVLFEGL
jgi:hypothetical protein